jgi:hypothetical protein
MSKKKPKGKHRGQAEGRREPLTAAHAADRAQVEAECGPDGQCDDRPVTGKAAIAGLEAEPGPGAFTEPVFPPGAEAFARPYLDTGRAAPSPQQGMPNTAPLPPQHPGILAPLPQSAAAAVVGTGPAAAGIAAHQARAAQSMPPVPRQ